MEMTKKEKLEHTRSLLDAIPIIRLYAKMSRKRKIENDKSKNIERIDKEE